MLEWGDLRVFLAIAREGTLGAAARQLGQTQPTMGRRLRALEAAVGQTLFQRTGEGFVLTSEGTSVLGHAERVEEEVLAFQRQLAPPRIGLAPSCWRLYWPSLAVGIRSSASNC
jgi:DNA-binding transcriptional LysR family regulator